MRLLIFKQKIQRGRSKMFDLMLLNHRSTKTRSNNYSDSVFNILLKDERLLNSIVKTKNSNFGCIVTLSVPLSRHLILRLLINPLWRNEIVRPNRKACFSFCRYSLFCEENIPEIEGSYPGLGISPGSDVADLREVFPDPGVTIDRFGTPIVPSRLW